MGVMTRMRENTGVVLWILVASFGVLWVLQDSGAFDNIGMATGPLISVNDEVITQEEYQNALQGRIQQLEEQRGEPLTPQQRDAVEQQVFNQLVEDRLREQEMDRIGITVTDEEVRQLVYGERPHPFIVANFSDGQGGIDQEVLRSWLDSPETQEQQIFLQDYLRRDRRAQKLQGLLTATARVSDAEVLAEYQLRNTQIDADFVALRYAAIPDDSVQLSEEDLEAFYDENREDFRRERTYTIQYVAASKMPGARDTALVVNRVEGLRGAFAQTENDSLFLRRQGSVRPFDGSYQQRDDLPDEIAEVVFDNPEPGSIIGPVTVGGQVHLIKVLDTREAEEPVVEARHILVRAPEGDTDARQEARAEAQALLEQLREGADFAQLALAESDDTGSARRGGDLGYFGRDRMVEPFADAAFDAEVGELVGPVETRFGYHLIEVTDRSDQEVRIAQLVQNVETDIASLNEATEQLGDLAYFVEEEDRDFAEYAREEGLTVEEVTVEERENGQIVLPRLGRSAEVERFLGRAEEGDISDVIELDEQYVAIEVVDIEEAGYAPLSDTVSVRPIVERRALQARKQEIQLERLQEAVAEYGADLSAIADAVGATVRTATNVSPANPTVPGLGRSPKFVGTALGVGEGDVSGAVEGETAAFVLRPTDIVVPETVPEAEAASLRQSLVQARQSRTTTGFGRDLRESADIEDNRAAYYQ